MDTYTIQTHIHTHEQIYKYTQTHNALKRNVQLRPIWKNKLLTLLNALLP